MEPGGLKNIGDLERGDHLCCLYETEDEQIRQLEAFILRGLREEEKVVCFADPLASEIYVENWESRTPAIMASLEAGRVSLVADRDAFSRGDSFHPDRLIYSLQTMEKKALSEGFAGLRVAAEATWVLAGVSDSAPFIELESKLARYLPVSRCALLVQYDRWVFDPSFLLDMLASHPVAVLGNEVYENIYHVPPEELLSRDISSTSLRLWLANLQANHRERELLKASEANFRGIFNAINDAIFIRDAETFRFVDANQTALEMFGATLEGVKESQPRFLNVDTAPPGEKDFSSIMDKVKRGYPQKIELLARDTEGNPFWTEGNIVSAVINGRELIISTVRDIDQRKQDEEALRETTEYLNSLITYANAPIIVWDPGRRITRFNRAFEHLTGYDWEEIVGRDLEVLFPADTVEESLGKIDDASSGERWESVEIPILAKDGEVRIALWNSANIYAADGETLLATIAQGQDITRRKRAEEALRISEANFRSVFDGIEEAIIIRDIDDHRIVDMNRKAEEMFGYSLNELAAGPPDVYISRENPFGLEYFLDKYRQVTEGETQFMEWKARHKDGHTFWVESSLVTADIGGQKRFVSTIRDISRRKEAEEELEKAEENYRELVENANSVILKWDGDRKITFFNEYAQGFFGYPEEEVLGSDVNILIPEKESGGRDITRITDQIVDNPEEYAYNENENVRRNGERVWVAWTNRAIKDREGNFVENLAIGIDITEKKRMEEQLQAVNRELSAYAHTISHDLHAPLSTIHGYAQVAEEACTEGNKEIFLESMGAIRRLTERMSTMIRSLLDYAEADKAQGEAERVPLGEALLEVLADHDGEIRAGGIEIGLREEYPVLRVDPVRLRQVLTNLLGNALKYTAGRPGPRIEVSAGEGGGWVTVSVTDNGTGIEPEIAGQVFEPFRTFRGDGTSGHGIGLATVRKAVEGWGGKIWVESEPGSGSTFFFTVPAAL